MLLLQSLQATEGPVVRIAGFYDHGEKLQAAADHIPEKRLLLHESFVQPGFAQKGFGQEGSSTTAADRLLNVYVDWDGQ